MFLEYLEEKGIRYFNLFDQPIMILMDISSGAIVGQGIIGGERGRAGLYTKLFLYGDKIVLVPWNARVISVFNKIDCASTSVEIPERESSGCQYGFFRTAVQSGRFIYAFGFNYPGIIKIDSEQEKADCIVHLKDTGESAQGFLGEMVYIGDEVFVPLNNSDRIAVFNTKTESLRIFSTGIETGSFIQSICHDGESFWLTFSSGKVFTFDSNLAGGCIQETVTELVRQVLPIRSSACFHGDVFFFPENGGQLIRYSHDDGTAEWINTPVESFAQCFYYVRSVEDELSFFCESNNSVYVYNQEKRTFESSMKQLNGEQMISLFMDNEICSIKEDGTATLKAFLKCIVAR